MIGKKLRALREDKDATQDDLAILLNVKRQTYSAYERDVSLPDLKTLISLAEYYNVTVDSILGVNIKKDTQNTIDDDILMLFQKLADKDKEKLKTILQYLVDWKKD